MPPCKRRQGICDRAGNPRRGPTNSARVIMKAFNPRVGCEMLLFMGKLRSVLQRGQRVRKNLFGGIKVSQTCLRG